jgi:hypothetical protein
VVHRGLPELAGGLGPVGPPVGGHDGVDEGIDVRVDGAVGDHPVGIDAPGRDAVASGLGEDAPRTGLVCHVEDVVAGREPRLGQGELGGEPPLAGRDAELPAVVEHRERRPCLARVRRVAIDVDAEQATVSCLRRIPLDVVAVLVRPCPLAAVHVRS